MGNVGLILGGMQVKYSLVLWPWGCHMECHTMEVAMRSQHQDYIRGIDVRIGMLHSNYNQFDCG